MGSRGEAGLGAEEGGERGLIGYLVNVQEDFGWGKGVVWVLDEIDGSGWWGRGCGRSDLGVLPLITVAAELATPWQEGQARPTAAHSASDGGVGVRVRGRVSCFTNLFGAPADGVVYSTGRSASTG